MEFIGHEIVALSTLVGVLLGAAAVAVALLSGLAAELQLHLEDLSHGWKARHLNPHPSSPRSRAQVAAELRIGE
jgi:hypothetical protein